MSNLVVETFPVKDHGKLELPAPNDLCAVYFYDKISRVLLNRPTTENQEAKVLFALDAYEVLEGNIHSDNQLDEFISGAKEKESMIGWIGFDGDYRFGCFQCILEFYPGLAEWVVRGDLPEKIINWRDYGRSVLVDVPLQPQSNLDELEFTKMIDRAQDYISAGDIYQVNLARKFHANWSSKNDPFLLYEELNKNNSSPWASFIELGDTQLVGSSPECFLEIFGHEVMTRPIKGTGPRFPDDKEQDLGSKNNLWESEKESSELLMITDLMRNDLGKICKFGSVTTDSIKDIESFDYVYHLVSTVTGELKEGCSHVEALRSTMPPGSISGAPKQRAIEIIDELEDVKRDAYTGVVGCFLPDQESFFSVTIRTAEFCREEMQFFVGSGIVADSEPKKEFDETNHKARGIRSALNHLISSKDKGTKKDH